MLSSVSWGQVNPPPPVPIWDEGTQPAQLNGTQRVFLTRDLHTIIVLAPATPTAGVDGPRKVVRIPLRNGSDPGLKVTISEEGGGRLRYLYSVRNGASAADEIGAWSLVLPPGDPDLLVISPGEDGQRPWGGGPPSVWRVPHTLIAQHPIFPEAPLGWYLLRYHQNGHVIKAGEQQDGFGVESGFRPGLTTAWFAAGPTPDFDRAWPFEVFEQLKWYEDRRWRERFLVTIAPMFSRYTQPQTIAESFRTGLAHMVEARLLDANSTFVREAVETLANWNPRSVSRSLKSMPQSGMESDVATALFLSLGIIGPGPR